MKTLVSYVVEFVDDLGGLDTTPEGIEGLRNALFGALDGDTPSPEFSEKLFVVRRFDEHPGVLMQQGYPTGWKLEDLALHLIEELRVKTAKIAGNTDLPSKVAVANNLAISNLLGAIRVLQGNTLAAFATVAPDPGPMGEPRVPKA